MVESTFARRLARTCGGNGQEVEAAVGVDAEDSAGADDSEPCGPLMRVAGDAGDDCAVRGPVQTEPPGAADDQQATFRQRQSRRAEIRPGPLGGPGVLLGERAQVLRELRIRGQGSGVEDGRPLGVGEFARAEDRACGGPGGPQPGGRRSGGRRGQP